jgi:nicotinamidase-related amidase
MSLPFAAGDQLELPDIPFAKQVMLPAAHSAVVVVDMQNDFVKPGGTLVVPDAEATISPIAALLERARSAGAHVTYTQDTHNDGDPEWQIWPEHCRKDTWGWQIVEELAPLHSDLVVQKARYDGFYDTPLDHYLSRMWGVKHLVIVGTVASICVLHTAASAGLRWYHVVTPLEGISALTPFDTALTLRQISWLYTGQVTRQAADIHFTST